MQIVGAVEDGRFGPMNENQATAWLLGKDGRKTVESKMKTCVSAILADSGSTSSGGGNTTYSYDGTPMYHTSSGAGSTQGATVFYAKRPGGVAKILGTGYHIGAQSYEFTWKSSDWRTVSSMRRISLD